ncbi:hypothetical protein [Promicromonospora sp. NPDC023805]|uniref:hypothetical protein n=1 Tax=Promicromonospora sp. NPDC023805 TaxID=3154696 RepID=UPI00341126E6
MTTSASLTTEDLEFLARPLHGFLSVAGRTTVEADGAHELGARLAARYWDLDDPAQARSLATILAGELTRVVIHPETVHRYVY